MDMPNITIEIQMDDILDEFVPAIIKANVHSSRLGCIFGIVFLFIGISMAILYYVAKHQSNKLSHLLSEESLKEGFNDDGYDKTSFDGTRQIYKRWRKIEDFYIDDIIGFAFCVGFLALGIIFALLFGISLYNWTHHGELYALAKMFS